MPSRVPPLPVLSDAKNQMLDAFASHLKQHRVLPNQATMTDLGYTRDAVKHHFRSLENLRREAKKHRSAAFEDVIDTDLFTPRRFAAMRDEVRKFRRFVITTAVTGCSVHPGFYAAIKRYCAANDAVLLVLPSSDPAAENSKGYFLDPVLKPEHIVFDDMQLNSNLFIAAIKVSAKQIDPTTGLGRIGQRNGSFVYASPKQLLKMVATSTSKMPHALMTTGALTLPGYDSDLYMSHRTAYIADNDHVMGAIVIEIEDNKTFFFRQVQADKKGSFADLGKLYTADGIEDFSPAALVLGDWHSGDTDERAISAFITNRDSVRAVTLPKIAIIHDGFNGRSISHHEEKNRVRRAQLAALNQVSLDDELRKYVVDLNMLTEKFSTVGIVQSNHDEFLHRYLQSGRFVEDSTNAELASLLFYHMCRGEDPLRYAVEKLIGLRHPERVRWLSRDEDFKIAGIELGAHGDLGGNGARGSLAQMEKAYGNSVSGHAHTPEILRGAWQVGTCSKLKLNYTRGSSSWLHCSCLVYPNGMRQLINIIGTKWALPRSKKMAM